MSTGIVGYWCRLSRARKRADLVRAPRILSASFSTKARYSRMPIRFASAASSSLTRQTSSCQSRLRSSSRFIDMAWFSLSAEFRIHATLWRNGLDSQVAGYELRVTRGKRARSRRTRVSREQLAVSKCQNGETRRLLDASRPLRRSSGQAPERAGRLGAGLQVAACRRGSRPWRSWRTWRLFRL